MRALITGVTGQDGAYLARLLLDKGYEVFGLYRRTSSPNTWRLGSMGLLPRITLISGDMTDGASLTNAILKSRPNEIYNLAAQSFVGTSFEQPLATAAVDGLGTVSLLEAAKQIDPGVRIYHASTSELYGDCRGNPPAEGLDENSTFWPLSPYAASKLYAFHQVRMYREAYGLFAVNGILFNHESPVRGLEFVTRKITNSVARIALGLQKKIRLGNLEAMRDWGYAPEYVAAMWSMLQQDKPEDFVIATGKSHSVLEFLQAACECAGLDWEAVVVLDDAYRRPLDVPCLRGNASRARAQLGWQHQTSFAQLAELMVEADLRRWRDHRSGKIFPWDAMNDPTLAQDG